MLIPKQPKPISSPKHLAWIRSLWCVACGVMGCDAHHLLRCPGRRGQSRSGDEYALPICAVDHRPTFDGSLHSNGDETAWFKLKGILDPVGLATALWENTGDIQAANDLILHGRAA